MKKYCHLAQSVKYNQSGSKVVLSEKDEDLELIGMGRSAFAFKIKSTNLVLKVFFPSHTFIVKREAEVYNILSSNPFYPTMYESGENYLVIDFIEGYTLFNCLEKGIIIKNKHIIEIDNALKLAKEKGLNPADIHLRNILLTTEGKIKLIDVARFQQKGSCLQWAHLKQAYKYYSSTIFPKRIPKVIMNGISYLYKRKVLHFFL
ncbi:protein kinase family protein [Alkalihalobacterium sp. APHAB7]|uniref:protein kinase family protein n=1 Tax=Alkalihalobacterium sp. APHAB7 TaxID=3402081 RepID=UPI003AAA45CC